MSARLNDPTTSEDALALFTPETRGDYSKAPITHAVCVIRVDSTESNGQLKIEVVPVNCLPFAPWVADSVRHPLK
jgi:hypothetical protein